MKKEATDILIIGGGLTGLTIAYLLRNTNLSVTIVEARQRLGGRIHTLYKDQLAPQEMGATWIGSKHKTLLRFLKEIGVDTFNQTLGERAIFEPISTSPPVVVDLPPNTHPTFRIKGGTQQLIKTLASHIASNQIRTSQIIQSIKKEGTTITAQSQDTVYQAKLVVSTLPPNLLQNTVDFNPALPAELTSIMANTHTWMDTSIKFVLTYKEPFWRATDTGGTLASHVGPVAEMWDHSNDADNQYALKGFLNGTFYSLSKNERKVLILNQLSKYYDEKAANYLSYEESIWRNEKFTFTPYASHILPHQNHGHQFYQQALLDGQLIIAGSETSTIHPGYMDGAINSAYRVAESIKKLFI